MRFKSFAVALLLGFSTVAAARQASADVHAQQVFELWLAAYNSGERDALQTFLADYKVGQDAQRFLDIRQSLGTFKLVGVKSSTEDSAQLMLLSEMTDRGVLATLDLDPADRFDVTKLQLEGMDLPDEFKPQRMRLAQVLAAGEARLDAARAADTLSGALAVAKDGKLLMSWHGGAADREHAIGVDETTRFRLASLNKMFTAVAILQLQEAGKLSLDDKIALHLKNYPNQQIAEAVSIRQLLNHTSGLGDVFGEEFEKRSQSLRTLNDYWSLASATPLGSTPGSEDGYSNYGYILLGSIIEAVSGQSYYDYVDQHIYRVAGMSATGSEPESTAVPGRAVAYTKVDGKWAQETKTLPWRGTSAGGGYSTVGDMLKFAEALRAGRLISPTSLGLATAPQNNKGWYGYGFMVSGQGAQRQYGHEGGAPGANASLVVLPAQGYVVVGLSNVDPGAMENVVNFIVNRLPL
ncbi:serine hydrolase domain-containing protein [Stenotrophomonas terrae]|uniref:serine hydrolase domain-containing protein n=1 Tax=Stenotrophomonas terrae TaxID=405446 RepID=UPI003209FB09